MCKTEVGLLAKGCTNFLFYKITSSRHGGWLTFGNLDLHLIKGIPAVHPNDEIYVGHITIEVNTVEMAKIKEKLHALGILAVGNMDKPNVDMDQVFEESDSLSHTYVPCYHILGVSA